MRLHVFVPALCLGITLLGCAYKTVEGDGKPVSETRSVEPFNAIQLKGSFQVIVDTGQSQQVILTTDENIASSIETAVKGHTLIIKPKSGVRLKPTAIPTVNITIQGLQAISSKGSSNINIQDLVNNHFIAELKGSGNLHLAGKTEKLIIGIKGSGAIDAKELQAKAVTINMRGSGEVIARAEQQLEITLSGSGKISYYGNPSALKQNIRGSGQVTHLTNKE